MAQKDQSEQRTWTSHLHARMEAGSHFCLNSGLAKGRKSRTVGSTEVLHPPGALPRDPPHDWPFPYITQPFEVPVTLPVSSWPT